MNHWVLGIDIGGTHISCCIVDILNNRILEESFIREDVRANDTADAILEDWLRAIRKSLSYFPATAAIGVAMPGPFDYENGVSLIKGLQKYEALYGLNIKKMLSIALDIPTVNIQFLNDASCYLLGEIHFGAAKGETNVVGITLGTGLGSGQYHQERLIEGDLWCTPFKSATAEDYMAARWLINEYHSRTGTWLQGVKDLALIHDPLVDAIFQIYGQHLAQIILQRYHDNLPEVVVVGGNIAKAWDRFMPHAQHYLQEQGHNIRCIPALLGERAALLGAASCFKR